MTSSLLAVVGARGGVGATTFAVALARCSGAVLVDVDNLGGGVDVALAIEDCPGVRWSGLRLAGGHLDGDELIGSLPTFDAVPVLAADAVAGPAAGDVEQVLAALTGRPVVVDVPRRLDDVTAAVFGRCDLLVVMVPASVAGSVAGHVLVQALPPRVTVGIVVRGPGRSAPAVAAAVGRPLLGSAADLGAVARAAAGVVAGLAA